MIRFVLSSSYAGRVCGGGGGGGDDGGLAVQEAGRGGDRGGGGGVPGRGGLRRHVRVGLQRAGPDRADAHPGMQLLRRRAHRQRRRRPLLRRPAPGLVRRRLTAAHMYSMDDTMILILVLDDDV